jgi:hypothetical protein
LIAPGLSGFDSRTFECGKCDYIRTATVDIDPMKSKLIGGRLTGAERVGRRLRVGLKISAEIHQAVMALPA